MTRGARTLLGFDPGSRKIGVAVGQTLTGSASGLESIRVTPDDGHFDKINRLVREWRPDGLVVGLPLDAMGGETASSRAARSFGAELHKRFGLPVYWVNEHLTSHAAQQRLVETVGAGKRFSKNKQRGRDLLAAAMILESYLESRPA